MVVAGEDSETQQLETRMATHQAVIIGPIWTKVGLLQRILDRVETELQERDMGMVSTEQRAPHIMEVNVENYDEDEDGFECNNNLNSKADSESNT
jgi:hypothetical protein